MASMVYLNTRILVDSTHGIIRTRHRPGQSLIKILNIIIVQFS